MGLFTLIRDVTSAKVNAFTGSGATKPQHTAVPLNLHQGSAVQLPDLDLALAQADGSILPNVLGSQTITAVGKMRIFNLDVFHSYLADGTSFIRTVADGYNVKDVTLFTNKDEIIPATNEDWEFWLGRYQEMTDGSSTLAEAGFPGFVDYTWVGLFFPAKTSPEIIKKINQEISLLLKNPDFLNKLNAVGFEPVGGTVQEGTDYLKGELSKWAKVVKEIGMKVE